MHLQEVFSLKVTRETRNILTTFWPDIDICTTHDRLIETQPMLGPDDYCVCSCPKDNRFELIPIVDARVDPQQVRAEFIEKRTACDKATRVQQRNKDFHALPLPLRREERRAFLRYVAMAYFISQGAPNEAAIAYLVQFEEDAWIRRKKATKRVLCTLCPQHNKPAHLLGCHANTRYESCGYCPLPLPPVEAFDFRVSAEDRARDEDRTHVLHTLFS